MMQELSHRPVDTFTKKTEIDKILKYIHNSRNGKQQRNHHMCNKTLVHFSKFSCRIWEQHMQTTDVPSRVGVKRDLFLRERICIHRLSEIYAQYFMGWFLDIKICKKAPINM
jgi:hypothetical protein